MFRCFLDENSSLRHRRDLWSLWSALSVTSGSCFHPPQRASCASRPGPAIHDRSDSAAYSLHYEKFNDGSVKCIEDEIPFELPEGWAWERLSNLASFSGGKTPSTSRSEYWNGDILWVTSKDMKSKYIDSSQLKLSELGAAQMQIHQPGTLLLVARSGILRHTLPVAILTKTATINQDLKAIALYTPELAEFVYACLKGMEPQLLLKYTKSGTTVENINFDEFQKILLPVAPTKQIAEIVDSVKYIV